MSPLFIFFSKTDDLFLSSLTITIIFYHFLLLSLGCHPFEGVTPHLFHLSDLVSPLFFVNLPTIFFSFGCHPLEGVTRGGPPSPSDATVNSTLITLLMNVEANFRLYCLGRKATKCYRWASLWDLYICLMKLMAVYSYWWHWSIRRLAVSGGRCVSQSVVDAWMLQSQTTTAPLATCSTTSK